MMFRASVTRRPGGVTLLEWLTKRSERSSGGCGWRGGTGVYDWYMRIPSTGRARLAAAQ
ncbi:hypothetical protein XHV734_1445 [Xanthomonas hortorum pv. vitians]|nr:hypothetical protein XHV734_1445 [Xanthomonas hortorum pv. vitians]